MKKIFILIISLALAAPSVLAQVGFNNITPDASSVIDLTATDKGLLIPRMTTAQRQAIVNPAQSLLVFDTTDSRFYFYNGGQWYALNEWDRLAGGTSVTYTGRVGINTTTPAASSVLDLTATDKGLLVPRMTAAQRQAIVSPAAALLVFDTTDNKFYYFMNGQWKALNLWNTTAGNDISYTGNVTINGNLSATSFGGVTVNGVVPKGGIIMWSGSIASIPTGWALCNGANGTPNLTDRFIVGAGKSYPVGETAGQNFITLTAAQSGLPVHNHGITDPGHNHSYQKATGTLPQSGSKTQVFVSNTIANTNSAFTGIKIVNTVAADATKPFDNRPLYYALAYIMKL